MNNKSLKSKINPDMIQPLTIILILIVLCAIFTIINPTFIKLSNIHSILLTAVPLGLIAIGECVCIITGQFDMSVGMVASMGGLVAAQFMISTGSAFIAIVCGIGVGLISGIIAGILVSYLKMNAFIATFALQSIYRGLIYINTGGFPIPLTGGNYEAFTKWGQSKLFGAIQYPIIIMIVIYIVVALFLRYRRMGRSVYLTGLNVQCAKISGINVHATHMLAFILCDVLAALAGVLYASRMSSAACILGETFAMEAIAATIVGGTSLLGGKGNLALTFVGVMIIYVVKNGLIMIGLPDYYQYIAVGLILFLAVFLQVEHKKSN